MLLKRTTKLPAWFIARVPKGQLEAGSGSGITFYQHDIDGAHEWVRTARRWREHYGITPERT